MSKSKIINILEMLVIIAAGVLVIIYPGRTLEMVAKIIGIALIIYGAIAVIGYFARNDRNRSAFRLLVGILSVIVGIIILVKPALIVGIFPIATGLMIAAAGIRDIIFSLRLKNLRLNIWKIALILSVITVIFGIIIFLNPFETMETLVILLGVSLIYNGIAGLIFAFN